MVSFARANVGAWMLSVSIEQPSMRKASFAQNLVEIFLLKDLKNFPQFAQKLSRV